MKKAVVLVPLAIAVMLSGCGTASDQNQAVENVKNDVDEQVVAKDELSNNGNTISAEGEQEVTKDSHSIQAQLQVIASHVDLWALPADYANEVYHYAVTDLDSNGRLEIIASNTGGTGHYTYSTFYEINENYDGLMACEHISEEGDSQADLSMADSVPGYYDSQKGIMYYIFDDYLKNGAAEYYENKRALYLEKGQIKEIPLAYKSTIYTDSTPNTTYMDKDLNEISEEEYNRAADRVFEDLEKKEVRFGWYELSQPDELRSMSMEELMDLLRESYEKFAIE